MTAPAPDPALDSATVARFAAELDVLVEPGATLGVAVSGGPDSLALLLLAAAACPGRICAATVDHRLRDDSSDEAALVAGICARLGVPHVTLPIEWAELPSSSLQARAREARYAALGRWAVDRRLAALATAHHLDDQAETLLMRLARGAGIGGLSGIRRRRPLNLGDDKSVPLIRPLLGWRRAELGAIVAACVLAAVDDPANRDPRHDRTRAREFIAGSAWPDPARLAASAAHLAEAEQALQFAAARLFQERCRRDGEATVIDPSGLPREFQRRLLLIALSRQGEPPPRGPDLVRLLALLAAGRTATLAGLRIEGGATWRLTPAPPRRP